MHFILGSTSPRRQEILQFFNLPFEVVAPQFAEELVPFEGDPAAYARVLAEGKALSTAERFPKATVLAADTIVHREGKLYEKPASDEEAFAMLSELNGTCHSVFTAVTAIAGEKKVTEVEETVVEFHAVDEGQIRRYHRAFHSRDKAGGYGIQMGGSLIVKRIDGCFYNVMGLPLNALQTVLKGVGIDLWNHLS